MNRKSIPIYLLLALIGCSGAGADDASTEGSGACEPGAPIGLEVGMCAPDFSLPNADGVEVKLSSFRGKVALVDISALW